MNIAQFCIDHKVLTWTISLAVFAAGVSAYRTIGRLEDPEFTIKSAQIITYWPGATASEVASELTEPIETAVQQMGQLKRVTSTSYPGRSVVAVEMQDQYDKSTLPQVWDELRRKVNDKAPSLPSGAAAPIVFDSYGDVYGMYFVIYGDGYSMAELKDHAKMLRRELLLCDQVAKIDMIGDIDEVVYFEISRARLANLGISISEIKSLIAGQNDPVESGHLTIGDKYVRIDPTGKLASLDDLGELLVVHGDAEGHPSIRLRDIATIRRAYEDPPSAILRHNGHPCIALGVSTVAGGNVIVMAKALEKRMKELESTTPIGIEVGVVSNQAETVDEAISSFMVNLVEAVVIVIAVLLFFMGLRSGLIIGGVLLLTVMATIAVMKQMGVLMERISLGAFIIALGMLVDNSIVVNDAVLVAAQKGMNKVKAACDAVRQNMWPLLGGTAIAILSFAPIGASQDASGEYCRSLFYVLMVSLFFSWLFALTVTPLLSVDYLKSDKKGGDDDPYAGGFYKAYRGFLAGCLRNRYLVLAALVVMLIGAFRGFGHVGQNFFPDSTRKQMMVHFWMPEGSSIYATDKGLSTLSDHVSTLEGVTGTTQLTGTGGLRFILTYAPENDDEAYGLLFVDLDDYNRVPEISAKIDEFVAENLPDVMVSCQRFILGPGDAQKIQLRILGTDADTIRGLGEKALEVFRADGHLVEVQTDWRNRTDLIRPIVSPVRLRTLGITRQEVANAFKTATDGVSIGTWLEGDESIDIRLRAPESERSDPDSLFSAWFHPDGLAKSIPLMQVISDFKTVSEDPIIQRRNRLLCLTVKANPGPGDNANAAFARLCPRIEELAKTFPEGYVAEWGGEHENSAEANAGIFPKVPGIVAIMFLITVFLFDSIRKPLVIFCTVPLILVGVVAGLLSFDQPFGFMALLGLLSLIGMQIKNAIVIIDEINARTAAGDKPLDAVLSAGVTRLRPLGLSAATTVLGMIPLVADPFYAAMAVTVMCGLGFATLLTLVVIPVNYALFFRLPSPE
ncbi:MAG: efflux RND transporter permease subunit [Kiritimatiellae bacterium]|nr:efflux RND transporter permease subunit [Kiritimatiellia bacterium]MBQ6329747.1 efflux RND transporter permease subunit [Kiritimatiellia bacterium]